MAEDNDLNGEDLQELHGLLSAAKRPRVQRFLRREIEALEKNQGSASGEQEGVSEVTPNPVGEVQQSIVDGVAVPVEPLHRVAAPQSVHYISLSRFSYDQDVEKLKIYIFLEGASQDKIVADFKANSFDIKIHDVGGKSYRCGVPKLCKAIIPEKCVAVVKPKKIIITLKKAEKHTWPDIHYKEDKFKPPGNSDKDPMAGIMDLMKNMYDEGDDETKRTIAKAWSESRSGKTSDPLSKFGGI